MNCGAGSLLRVVGGSGLAALTCLTTTTRFHLHTHSFLYPPKHGQTSGSKSLWKQSSRSLCHAAAVCASPTPGNSPENYFQVPNRIRLLMDFFDISISTYYKLLKSHHRLKTCDVYHVDANIKTLLKHDIHPSDVRNNLPLLYRNPLRVEHDISILKDLGLLNLKADDFLCLVKLFKYQVGSLKRTGLVPNYYDPGEFLLGPLGLPSHRLSHHLRPSQLDSLTLHQVYMQLSEEYLFWQLNCSKEAVNKIRETYSLLRKSITLQHKLLYQLKSYWNIDAEKVIRNGYLLNCSPTNLGYIGTRVQKMAQVDIRELVALSPRILTIPYHHLLHMDSILCRLEVSQAAVKAIPWVCTLKPNTVEERIHHLEQVPELGALRSHPRVLRLIVYYKKVKSRLDHLQQDKKTNTVPSLNTLSGDIEAFNKYVKMGNHRRDTRDILTFMSEYFNVSRIVARDTLHARCWGQQSTVVNVRKNLVLLGVEGFSRDQVYSALDLVLYPPDIVQDQLAQLPHRPQLQPYSEFKHGTSVLQLLLYYVEKNSP